MGESDSILSAGSSVSNLLRLAHRSHGYSWASACIEIVQGFVICIEDGDVEEAGGHLRPGVGQVRNGEHQSRWIALGVSRFEAILDLDELASSVVEAEDEGALKIRDRVVRATLVHQSLVRNGDLTRRIDGEI